MVTAADVAEDSEFKLLYEDVQLELNNHGKIVSLLIPRKGRFVGFIFVEYAAVTEAQKAFAVLEKKTFAEKKVLVEYNSQASLDEARMSDR